MGSSNCQVLPFCPWGYSCNIGVTPWNIPKVGVRPEFFRTPVEFQDLVGELRPLLGRGNTGGGRAMAPCSTSLDGQHFWRDGNLYHWGHLGMLICICSRRIVTMLFTNVSGGLYAGGRMEAKISVIESNPSSWLSDSIMMVQTASYVFHRTLVQLHEAF